MLRLITILYDLISRTFAKTNFHIKLGPKKRITYTLNTRNQTYLLTYTKSYK